MNHQFEEYQVDVMYLHHNVSEGKRTRKPADVNQPALQNI